MRALIVILLLAVPASAAPDTVYESPDIPPQAMDYDADADMFKAHPGWVNDKLIHYYKFRMYVPPNYGMTPGSTAQDMPVQDLFLPTADGTLAGVAPGQAPILSHHHRNADGLDYAYSDFMHIVLVTVGAGEQPRSAAALAGFPQTPTGIIVNSPLVPTGSTLEDPAGGVAPIDPWMAWFDGDAVQLFAFETTDAAFAAWLNQNTRPAGSREGSGYEAAHVPGFATANSVEFLPIWHVNQYATGVTPGVNNGGPAGVGQRNVISHDRGDDGYSPLWQVMWATKVPVGYTADQASHPSQFSGSGFDVMKTGMFVNCPNIGPVGGSDVNGAKVSSFDTVVEGAATIEGSVPMQANVEVVLKAGDKEVGRTKTAGMGAYSFDVDPSALPAGTTELTVYNGEAAIGTWPVGASQDQSTPLVLAPLLVGLVLLGLRRRAV